MGVLVCYDDFTYDVINDYQLDYLVETGCIVGYDKSGEWVKTENFLQHAPNCLKQSGNGSPDIRSPKKR